MDKRSNNRGSDVRETPTNNLSKVERDIRAYELTLAGCSVRGVCQELGIKSTQTAHNAIKRGKEIVLERGIDIEERRIDIDRMFKETLGVLVQTARHQAEHGQEEFYVDQDGRKSMKRRVGIDPRIAGELSRSLNRWAEFCGLLERAPEQNNAITMVNLSGPSDGASFSDRWSTPVEDPAVRTGETVDVQVNESGSESKALSAGPEAPQQLERPTAAEAVIDEADGSQGRS